MMISTPEIIRASDSTRLTRSAGSITPFGISTQFLLEERFGDYRDIDGLFLPHVRRVRLTRQGKDSELDSSSHASRDLSILEWQMEYETWELNPEFGAKHFKLN